MNRSTLWSVLTQAESTSAVPSIRMRASISIPPDLAVADNLYPPVRLHPGGGGVGGDGHPFAEAVGRGHPRAGAERDLGHRVRTALRQAHVVFVRGARVGVAMDAVGPDALLPEECPEPLGLGRADGGAVGGE